MGLWVKEEKNGRHSTENIEMSNKNKDSKKHIEKQYKKNNNKQEITRDNKRSTNTSNININNEEYIYSDNEDNDRSKKQKRKNKILKTILIILITILIVLVSIFAKYMIKSGGNLSTALKTMFKDVVGDQDPIFVLVMGISEDISVELTDTLMLIGYNPDTNQAFVLSIPRDTFVGTNESKASGYDKINALYQKDPQKTIDAVENLTGININYYVTVKTSVLVKVVDTIGGVEFDVPINMDYDDSSQDLHIHLKAGHQKINGDQAEQLVRFRHNNNGSTYSASYGDNDEGRTKTQREFLKVLATKVLSTRDVDQIKSIAKDVFDNIETNIKLEQAFGYIPYAIDFNMEDLQMEQLPGATEMMNSLWFFKADTKKTDELIQGYVEKLGLTDAEKKIHLKQTNKTTTNNTSKSNTNTTNKSNKSSSNTVNNKTTNKKNNTTTTNKNTTKKETTKNETTKNEVTNKTTDKPQNNDNNLLENKSENKNETGGNNINNNAPENSQNKIESENKTSSQEKTNTTSKPEEEVGTGNSSSETPNNETN